MSADFSRIAPLYRWLEHLVFGKALQRRRLALLQIVGGAQNALILGDGDGRFTAEYIGLSPATRVDFVDFSPGMVHLARQRAAITEPPAQSLVFHVRDARSMEFEGPYDLVVTHFFLDCFSTGELETLLPRIGAATTDQAQWLISEFALPGTKIRRIGARALIRIMYNFFRWTAGLTLRRLPDYGESLMRCGFRPERRDEEMGGLLVSELWKKTAHHDR